MNLEPLRHRNFALLWWAGLISLTGTWVLRVALPIYVLRLTGSVGSVSAVVTAALLGDIVAGSFTGAYADRWDRRRIAVVVNLAQAVILMPLVLAPNLLGVILVVACAESGLNRFLDAAETALQPRLVPAAVLPAAFALAGVRVSAARLAGPALGGVVAAATGLAGAALLDAASFAIAGLLCAAITGAHRAASEPGGGLLRELADGFRMIGRNRTVRAIFALIVVGAVGEGIMSTLFAAYVTRSLHATSVEMGWMMSAQAIGGIIGGLVAVRYAGRLRPVPMITACYAFFGCVDMLIFNCPRFGVGVLPVVVLLFGVVGLPVGVHVGLIWSLFQAETPDHLRGRVFSSIWMCAALSSSAGAAGAAAFDGSVGVLPLLTVAGAGAVVAGLLFRAIAGRGPGPLGSPVE